MNTKEAIELMEYCDTLSCGDNPQTGFCNQFLEVIELLKRGEKHKDMWEELYVVFGNNIIDDIASLTDVMEQLEQKYFPKGG